MLKTTKKRGVGRPPLAPEGTVQIAVRFPIRMVQDIDAIILERYGQAERNSVIRELVAEALDKRKGRR